MDVIGLAGMDVIEEEKWQQATWVMSEWLPNLDTEWLLNNPR